MEIATVSALRWTPPQGEAHARRGEASTTERADQSQPDQDGAGSTSAKEAKSQGQDGRTLTPEEERRVAELSQIDRNVRAHEAAHLAAGQGIVTSGASFGYTRGPDGKNYATSGEVGIDTSREEKPEDNIAKGQRIQAAALAPLDPSAQDYRVASVGARLEAEGYTEKARNQRAEQIARTYRGEQGPQAGSRVSLFA